MLIIYFCDFVPNYNNNNYELNLLYENYKKKKFSIIVGMIILYTSINFGGVNEVFETLNRIYFFLKKIFYKGAEIYEYVINLFIHINYPTRNPVHKFRILYKKKKDRGFAFQEYKGERVSFFESFENFEINPHYYFDFFDASKYYYSEIEFGRTKFRKKKILKRTKLYKTKKIKYEIYVTPNNSSKFNINSNLLINTILTTKDMSFRDFTCYLDSYRTIILNYKNKPKLRIIKKKIKETKRRLIYGNTDFFYYSHLFYTRFDKRMMDFLFANKKIYKKRQLNLIHNRYQFYPRNATFFNRSIYRLEYYRPHISRRQQYLYDQDGFKSQLFLYGVLLMLVVDVLFLDLFYLNTFDSAISTNSINFFKNFYIFGFILLVVCFFYHMQNRYYYKGKIRRYIKNKGNSNYRWRGNFGIKKIENDALFHQYNREGPVTVNAMLNNDHFASTGFPRALGLVNDKYYFILQYAFERKYPEQMLHILKTRKYPDAYYNTIHKMGMAMYEHYGNIPKGMRTYSELFPDQLQPAVLKRLLLRYPTAYFSGFGPYHRPDYLERPSYNKIRRKVRNSVTLAAISYDEYRGFTKKNLYKYESNKGIFFVAPHEQPINDRMHKTFDSGKYGNRCDYFNIRRRYIDDPDLDT